MKKYISIFLAVFALLPATSQAYYTTEQTAVQLTPTTAMYTITYTFGPSAYDFYLPAHTSRSTVDSSNLTLTYDLLIDGEEVTQTGESAAIVLSNTNLSDKQYHLPRGKRGTFTLVTFFKTDAATPEADYALKVNGLPFNEDRGNEVFVENQLTKSELSDYQTEEVELNE